MLYEIVLIEVMVNPPQGQDSGGERGGGGTKCSSWPVSVDHS